MWFLPEMLSLSWCLNHILILNGLLVVVDFSKSITFPASQVDVICCSLKTPWYCFISVIDIYFSGSL